MIFYTDNGYYENGKLYRGDKYSGNWSNRSADYNITGGATGIDYGNAATVAVTISGHLVTTGTSSTPILATGTDDKSTQLAVVKGGATSFQSSGFNNSRTQAVLTSGAIHTIVFTVTVGGQEKLYLDGVLKTTFDATYTNLGNSIYPLTGYASNGTANLSVHNIALYNRVLTDEEISTISATLLANAGGAV
jgi:hypothetical protein